MARSERGPGAARRCFQADLARYFVYLGPSPSRWQKLATCVRTEAIWSLALFRLGQYLRTEAPRPTRWLLRFPYAIVFRLLRMAVGIHLWPQTKVGPGLYIGHYGGIWINQGTVIGANCNINHAVTLGDASGKGAPMLGDRVWVGPSATISGPVRIGTGAVIGANSLVVAHVPENAVVVGVPSRIISLSGSGHLIHTPGERAPAASAVAALAVRAPDTARHRTESTRSGQ